MTGNGDYRLCHKPPQRGIFPLWLTGGDGQKVLWTGQVNPHKPRDVEKVIAEVCKELPGLKDCAEDLRTELMQLAAPSTPATASRVSNGEDQYQETETGLVHMKQTPNGPVPQRLTNFTARIISEVIRDDGVESERTFEIQAKQGDRVETFCVSAVKFNGMNWPAEHLGASGIIYAGQMTRDHARTAIQIKSGRPPRRSVLVHTGWRKVENAWVYLHSGGAIGGAGPVQGIQVELPEALAGYQLPDPPQGEALKTAIAAALRLLNLAPPAIIVPLFAAIWRTALGPCDFALHVAGATGVFKTELAVLIQQHFGAGLDAENIPGNWSSTENATEGLLFHAKDVVTLLDDFAPTGPPHEIAMLHRRADRLIRAQGNRSGRARMRADGSLRPLRPPRGLILSTGEEVPRGQSLRARMLILELARDDIPKDALTACQQDARAGLYAQAMSGYLQYLAGTYEAVSATLRANVERLRDQAATSDAHRRVPQIVANLMVGLRYFIDFAQRAAAITAREGEELLVQWWAALGEAGSLQGAHQVSQEPAARYVELLTAAVASGQAHLANPAGEAPAHPGAYGWRNTSIGTGSSSRPEWQPQGARVGWVDGNEIYLEPEASYKAACGMGGTGGDSLAVSSQTLRKRLDEKGMLIKEASRPDRLLVRRMLQGQRRYVLHMAGGVLFAEPAQPAQLAHNGRDGVENGENGPLLWAGNRDQAGKTGPENPAGTGPGSPENAGMGRLGRLGRFPEGDTTVGDFPNNGQQDDAAGEAYQERAAIQEFDGGLSRSEAERRAAQEGPQTGG
jgi:hypothetical protein